MNSEIVGTKGRIEISDIFPGSDGHLTVVTEEGIRHVPIEESNRYQLEVTDFTAAILEGHQPLLKLEESLRNMRSYTYFILY